ncbi:hypothetical protein FB107DRAFT_218329 [Schizophyllum commune]
MVTIIPSISLCAKCEHTAIACSYPDTPSHGLLRSQYAPSEAEKAALASDMTNIDSWLMSLDLNITAIEERLAALRTVRAQVVIDRDKKHSLLAPIRRLPTEILALIIRDALPPKWRSEGSATCPFPLIDSCYRLRSIAHSMPELWVRLLWHRNMSFQQSQDVFLARAQLCNERARNEALDLIVPNFRIENRAAHWISSHLDRFRTLYLYVQYKSQPTETLSAPLLEYARLCTSDYIVLDRANRYKVPFGIELDAPRLRKLELYYLLAPSRVHVSWALLEDLTLELKCFGLSDLKPLRFCTSLKTLRFGNGSFWPGDEHDDPKFTITLSALRTISLGECGLHFCRYLVVPRLEKLVLQSVGSWYGSGMPAVQAMLQNSDNPGYNTLQSMTLTTHWLVNLEDEEDPSNGQDYLSVLRCTPAVRYLTLSYQYEKGVDLNIVLRALVITPGEGPTLLPALERLSIYFTQGYRTFDDELKDLLEEVAVSRWATDDGTLTLRLVLSSPNCGLHFNHCGCATRGAWPEELRARGVLVDQVPCKSVQSEWDCPRDD